MPVTTTGRVLAPGTAKAEVVVNHGADLMLIENFR